MRAEKLGKALARGRRHGWVIDVASLVKVGLLEMICGSSIRRVLVEVSCCSDWRCSVAVVVGLRTARSGSVVLLCGFIVVYIAKA